jgi:hypothetical protein
MKNNTFEEVRRPMHKVKIYIALFLVLCFYRLGFSETNTRVLESPNPVTVSGLGNSTSTSSLSPVSVANTMAAQNLAAQVEALPNTAAARRQELRQLISGKNIKNNKRVIEAARELIGFGVPEDIVFLVKYINQFSNTDSAKAIKKVIIAAPAPAIIDGLKRAGQDTDIETNFAAANILIDKQQTQDGLHVMTSLIKKGVLNAGVVAIAERAPKFEYTQAAAELKDLGNSDALPRDVNVFAELIIAAFIGEYEPELNSWGEDILGELRDSDRELALTLERLLEKALDHDGCSLEILQKVSKANISGVSNQAVLAIRKFEMKLKEHARLVLEGKSDDIPDPSLKYSLIRYFSGPNASKADTQFLLRLLQTSPDSKLRDSIALHFNSKGKYEELVLPVLRKVAAVDRSFNVRDTAIFDLKKRGLEHEAFDLFKISVIKGLKENDCQFLIGPFLDFKDPGVRKMVKLFLIATRDEKNATFNEKLYGALMLKCACFDDNKKNDSIIDASLKAINFNNMEDVLRMLSEDAYNQFNAKHIDEMQRDIQWIERVAAFENKKNAQLAQVELERIHFTEWWHRFRAGEKQVDK